MKSVFIFITDVLKSRSVILELVKRDIQQKYMGSYLGFIWVFLQPLLFVSVLFLVFSLGFRVGQAGEMPFSVYLITGFIAWIFFTDNFVAMTGSIKSYSFLVKRVDFRLSILPIVKLLSSLVPHIFLIGVAITIAWYEGYPPTIYLFQLIYYLIAASVLLLGLGWISSSCSIFVKDITNIVSVVVQFGFWLTPIFWNINLIPQEYQWIVKLNPMYYIVTGYRDSLVSHVPFWARMDETLYFWIFSLVVLILGIVVYKKLRPHFAEVL